jgi:hypothetical protein
MSSFADAEQWAGRLVAGETARLAAAPAGHPAKPMAMPAIGEVAAARQTLSAARSRQSTVKDTYDKEQSDVETARPPVDTLIADMWDTIEFQLRTLDGPSRRRRAREWGVVYLNRPGETPDPEQPTGGGATAPPAPEV